MPGDAEDKNELIAAADIALYHGKAVGRRPVMRASDVPGQMRICATRWIVRANGSAPPAGCRR
jgi:predicted signal transduction protein with EAL and GGDEF domain